VVYFSSLGKKAENDFFSSELFKAFIGTVKKCFAEYTFETQV